MSANAEFKQFSKIFKMHNHFKRSITLFSKSKCIIQKATTLCINFAHADWMMGGMAAWKDHLSNFTII